MTAITVYLRYVPAGPHLPPPSPLSTSPLSASLSPPPSLRLPLSASLSPGFLYVYVCCVKICSACIVNICIIHFIRQNGVEVPNSCQSGISNRDKVGGMIYNYLIFPSLPAVLPLSSRLSLPLLLTNYLTTSPVVSGFLLVVRH